VVSVNDCSVFVMERERKGGAPSTYMTLPPCQLLISNINPRTRFASSSHSPFEWCERVLAWAGAHLALDAMGADLALANRKVGFACRLKDVA
jgi:hypothetical protein